MDDDTYVNVPGLMRLLQGYNHTQDWYLGKPSLSHPLEITDIENPQVMSQLFIIREQSLYIWEGVGRI